MATPTVLFSFWWYNFFSDFFKLSYRCGCRKMVYQRCMIFSHFAIFTSKKSSYCHIENPKNYQNPVLLKILKFSNFDFFNICIFQYMNFENLKSKKNQLQHISSFLVISLISLFIICPFTTGFTRIKQDWACLSVAVSRMVKAARKPK